jgi:hypothetical protein
MVICELCPPRRINDVKHSYLMIGVHARVEISDGAMTLTGNDTGG